MPSLDAHQTTLMRRWLACRALAKRATTPAERESARRRTLDYEEELFKAGITDPHSVRVDNPAAGRGPIGGWMGAVGAMAGALLGIEDPKRATADVLSSLLSHAVETGELDKGQAMEIARATLSAQRGGGVAVVLDKGEEGATPTRWTVSLSGPPDAVQKLLDNPALLGSVIARSVEQGAGA